MGSERPAGRGEHDRLDGIRRVPVEALEERRVLAVDGNQQPSPTPVRLDRVDSILWAGPAAFYVTLALT